MAGKATSNHKVHKVGANNLSRKMSNAARRREVAFRYMKGDPVGVIAELLFVRKKWLEDAKMAMDERKAQELARIDKVEEEAWKGWQRSIERQRIYTKRTRMVRVPVKGGRKSAHKKIPAEEIAEQTIKSSSGDPRFLEQIERCITLRLKIFGQLKGDTTNQNQVFIDWSGLVGRGESVNPVEEEIKNIENQSKVTPSAQHVSSEARSNVQQVIEGKASVR
jgi:hypothetical protein